MSEATTGSGLLNKPLYRLFWRSADWEREECFGEYPSRRSARRAMQVIVGVMMGPRGGVWHVEGLHGGSRENLQKEES